MSTPVCGIGYSCCMVDIIGNRTINNNRDIFRRLYISNRSTRGWECRAVRGCKVNDSPHMWYTFP